MVIAARLGSIGDGMLVKTSTRWTPKTRMARLYGVHLAAWESRMEAWDSLMTTPARKMRTRHLTRIVRASVCAWRDGPSALSTLSTLELILHLRVFT